MKVITSLVLIFLLMNIVKANKTTTNIFYCNDPRDNEGQIFYIKGDTILNWNYLTYYMNCSIELTQDGVQKMKCVDYDYFPPSYSSLVLFMIPWAIIKTVPVRLVFTKILYFATGVSSS